MIKITRCFGDDQCVQSAVRDLFTNFGDHVGGRSGTEEIHYIIFKRYYNFTEMQAHGNSSEPILMIGCNQSSCK